MAMAFNTGTLPVAFSSVNTLVTQSITIPADAKGLYVAVAGDQASNNGNGAPPYCRFNGVNMTLLASAPSSSSGQYLWLYFIANPTVGTFNITAIHSSLSIQLNSVCVTNAIPLSSTVNSGAVANTASPTSVMGSTTVGGKVLHFATFNNVIAADVTEVSSMTTIAKTAGADSNVAVVASYAQDATAGTTTASWTLSGAQRTSTLAVFLKELTTYVLTFNSGVPVTPGQTGISVTAGGFTARPTITATYTGGTLNCTNVSGSASAFSFDLEDRSEGLDYPLDGDTVTFTFTNGSEVATYVTTITKKPGEVKVIFSGPITSNAKFLGYHFVADGFNPEGAEFVYVPYDNLVVTTAGTPSVATTGTFTGWFRPAPGTTGAGNVYRYDFTITSPSTVVDLSSLGVNSTSPKFDGAYPLGNRP